MNQQWLNFLESQGGHIDEQGMARFTASEGEPASALCDLSHLGLIQAQGADAAALLQGQFTNDIEALTGTQSQLSSCCTPKGHMLMNFRIWRHDDAYFIQLPRERLPALLKRLSMFVLRSEVTLSDISDASVRIGIAGAAATTLLNAYFPGIPQQVEEITHHADLTLIRLPGEAARFEVVGDEKAMQALWAHCASAAPPMHSDHWTLLDIRAGIPAVYDATAEAFIPQMLNMQLINGVSFTKGCYCGQEIVARTQYRGTLKRRMFRAHIDGDHKPRPGDVLYSPSAEHHKDAGIIVDAAPTPGGGYEALAMLQIACVKADDVRLENDQGPMLRFMPLPYNLDAG